MLHRRVALAAIDIRVIYCFKYVIGILQYIKASKLHHKVSLCITARLYCWQVRLRTILVDSGVVINDSHLGTVLTPFDFLIVKPALFFVEMPFEFTPFEVFLWEKLTVILLTGKGAKGVWTIRMYKSTTTDLSPDKYFLRHVVLRLLSWEKSWLGIKSFDKFYKTATHDGTSLSIQ